MREELEKIFAGYGTEIRVERRGMSVFAAAAFLQPVENTDKEFPFAVTALGSVDNRRWICLTRNELQEGDRIWLRETCYEAVNCTEVVVAGETVYWRSILRREQEAAE